MTRHERLRRAGILCCHCLRNLAFYRAWHLVGRPRQDQQFWVNLNGNFIDVAVLEWCKLFADARGKHHYSKVVSDEPQFIATLLAALSLSANQLAVYRDAMRLYRDKFIAHLDNLPVAQVPHLTIALESTIILYDHLVLIEDTTGALHDAPRSGRGFYRRFVREGRTAYAG